MKTLFLHIAILFLLIACNKDDDPLQNTKEEIIPLQDTLRGVYSANTLLTNDRKWYVEGWVYVINKSSLRIEPGTTINILPDPSFRSGGGIIIVRDSRLIAQGTTGLPIQFQFTDTVRTHWNGVILMGNAPQRKVMPGWESKILPEGKELSYGGKEPEDSSGIIEHVNMDFPQQFQQALPAGILLLGVGNKTRVDHVMLHMRGHDVRITKYTEGYNDL
ncbi:hypothetical protein [[Flexibacter] sp. ATCC 35208]|uniref:hypothetical protein n=1 Tax=[Flexibacter] sp. ATCC 35208 TaxID=1936242 RepID=UPI0009C8E2AF|nr:hypothetical protein [[Flexibacter] sp. ATCC 35208]OMP80503.1 hypothetical protein BW716_03050 [[Flexibacter] sp. ATCC 35208]